MTTASVPSAPATAPESRTTTRLPAADRRHRPSDRRRDDPQGCRARHRGRLPRGSHRAERRRKDHALQRDLRPHEAHRGSDPARRERHHVGVGAREGTGGTGAHLPDIEPLPEALGARERAARGTGLTRRLGVTAALSETIGCCNRPGSREARGRRTQPQARHRRGRHLARRQAQARDRGAARDRGEHRAAGRADGRSRAPAMSPGSSTTSATCSGRRAAPC